MKLNKRYIIYLSIIVVLIGGIITINLLDNPNDEIVSNISFLDEEVTTITSTSNYFYVDVKGEVKKPGVYKVTEGMIVNDVIALAGGLTKNAYTNNINLATKVSEGSVIYIYKKSEIITTKNTTTTSSYKYEITDTTTPVSSGLVNINTASKEQLLTVSGIGESKADAIIEYRKNNPFKTIEDIMNVSGIGESLYAKIKEYITV